MFAEFASITLAVCLLLCADREERSAYGMSFETLLKALIFKMDQSKPCGAQQNAQQQRTKWLIFAYDVV